MHHICILLHSVALIVFFPQNARKKYLKKMFTVHPKAFSGKFNIATCISKNTENPSRDRPPTERAKAKNCCLNRPSIFLEEKQPGENRVVFVKSLLVLHLLKTNSTQYDHTKWLLAAKPLFTMLALCPVVFTYSINKITHYVEH